MSDEQREQGRDTSAPAESSRTDQNPMPSPAEPGAARSDASAPGAPDDAAQPGAAPSHPGQTPSAPASGAPGYEGPGDTGPGYTGPGYTGPGYTASGHPASGHPGQAYPTAGYAGQGYPTPGYASQGHPTPGYGGQGYPAQSNPGQSNPGQSNLGQSNPGQPDPGQSSVAYSSEAYPAPTSAASGRPEADTGRHEVGRPGSGPHDTGQFAAAHGAGAPGWPSGSPYGQPQGSTTSVIEKPRRQRGMGTVVAAALIAGIVGGGAGFGGAYALLGNGSSGTTLTQSPASAASNAANTVPGSVAAAAAKAMPSTVDIQVALSQGTAEGSGVILTADGDVLTNNHVVAGATGDMTVTLADGTEHRATVIGTSPSYDLAVIKLQGVSGLTPAALGESSSVQVGQQVVAIGSPQGLTGTVTTGIVSAFNRTVSVQGESGGAAVVYNGLQTDAPINQGNSGGPLVNLDGQVVGINSAIATGGSQSTGSIGLGFAIPVDQAKRVAQEIIQSGTATKPVLGVQGSTGGQTASGGGATISGVQDGSPAATAGLKAGDVVTKVGDAKVEDFSDLVARIGSYAPGQQVTLTVTSGGSAKAVQVTLGSQADKAASTSNGGENANPFGGSNGGSPFGNLVPFGGGGGN